MAPVVGLEYSGNKLIMCNVSGKVVVRDITSELDESSYWQTTITDPVTCFKMHPTQAGIAVSGGKENDVEIVQILPRSDDDDDGDTNNTDRPSSLRGTIYDVDLTDSINANDEDEDYNDTNNNGNGDDDEEGEEEEDDEEEDRAFPITSSLFPRNTTNLRRTSFQQRRNNDNDNINYPDDSDFQRLSGYYGLRAQLPSLLAGSHTAAVSRRLGIGLDGSSNSNSSIGPLDRARLLHRHSRRNRRLWRIWKAKNVANDEFDNPSPVWVSDVQFLEPDRPPSEGWRLAVATRFGEIRLYDTKSSRKPLCNIVVSDHPLVNLWFGLSESEFLFSDSQNVIRKFNWVEINFEELFKGPAAGGLQIDQQYRGVLAMGGMDKYLRVYDLNGKLKYRVNINSRISGVMILDDDHFTSTNNDEQRGQMHEIDHSDGEEPDNKRQRR